MVLPLQPLRVLQLSEFMVLFSSNVVHRLSPVSEIIVATKNVAVIRFAVIGKHNACYLC